MIYIALLRFVFIMLVVSLNMGRAALALVISGAVAIIFTRLSIPYIKKYRKRYDKAREESNRITTRVIMEHNTVVMNNMQDAELKKGEKALKEAPLW
jgi:membrane protein implicated in regulation of membrane protease activity